MHHDGGMQLLYEFTKQERKEESMDSLLFFLLISFGDFNKAHFNRAYLCDKHIYFNMPLTININQKRAKTSRYPEAAESLAKAPSLRRLTCLVLMKSAARVAQRGLWAPPSGYSVHYTSLSSATTNQKPAIILC